MNSLETTQVKLIVKARFYPIMTNEEPKNGFITGVQLLNC